ncbi:uncharacterized protein LOC124869724 isoform X4 [Girardinichthys multiradiatus]|uniref:uncharacterized protein LOC124869724 isoform X4 n=1 Tax=Girardinichthys multiradiatus TaxID=208333 RepID=UPI001FAC4AA1|nr:uncharacterized protein LOC124869724 isoform X4 [Girardinichthys multiradiatus]
MSSVQHLREFIRERLTAAAEEIFSEVEKTIVRYEEEHKIMVINWKPQIKLNRIGMELQRPGSEATTWLGSVFKCDTFLVGGIRPPKATCLR